MIDWSQEYLDILIMLKERKIKSLLITADSDRGACFSDDDVLCVSQ